MGYIDALKKKGSSDIQVARARVSELLKEQGGKCAECKKPLRPGYFKSVIEEKKEKPKIICSDCLVKVAKKH